MLKIENIAIDLLKPYSLNARTHSKKQIAQIEKSIREFGFNNPILINQEQIILAGHGRLQAAKQLGLIEVPTICIDTLQPEQMKAFILADNKIAENSGWNKEALRMEFESLMAINIDFDLTKTGFQTPEIDLILHDTIDITSEEDIIDSLPESSLIPERVSSGDLWKLGNHYLFCGDSLQQRSFDILLKEEKANLIFTDPPYNVAIDGNVCGKGKIKHAEFAFASGEMSESEFTNFLSRSFQLLTKYSSDGAIHYICMDWRHVSEIMIAAQAVYEEVKNICVWNKQLPGMGSLYRSQHEFIFVFKHGTAPHINNISLGKYGRNRSNIWDYPGVHISNSHSQDLKFHPTVKPVQMIADAIIDCSKQGDIILDSFGGSGSTLLACERTKRRARLIEYEPKYCDTTLYRFEKMTGVSAEKIKGEKNDR